VDDEADRRSEVVEDALELQKMFLNFHVIYAL
jgi:hypothetical protein